jgi:hypothetical protein
LSNNVKFILEAKLWLFSFLCAKQKNYHTRTECAVAETCENLALMCRCYRALQAPQNKRQNGIKKYARGTQKEVAMDTAT